ncbi:MULTISPECIES: hypothetical protein [unclassified Pseudomonas]|uniref:hypothetical protein n=1 Tax=unclassified Pseudomonas TaxID=196821 RepID=UPI001F5B4A65|nr:MULTISPECIES: hypothetical protein [unclassified Pseudomonas]WPN50599.1 hypothetical protein QMK52_16985 [Pseudomonas sp. P9_2]
MHIGLQVPWLIQRDFNRLELAGWGVVTENTVYKAVVQVVDGVAVVEFGGFARRVVLAAIENVFLNGRRDLADDAGDFIGVPVQHRAAGAAWAQTVAAVAQGAGEHAGMFGKTVEGRLHA